MAVFRRPRKQVVLLVVALLLLAGSLALVALRVTGCRSTTDQTTKETGVYVDKGDLWQWVNNRKTQVTKLGTVESFDWHPAGGDVIYLTKEQDGSYKIINRVLSSRQEAVLAQGTAELGPKLLCTANGVLVLEASRLPTARLLQVTVSFMGFDGTLVNSYWTHVPMTAEQFDRTTRLARVGETPLLLSAGGVWTIGASSLQFTTAYAFLGPQGVTFADETFFGPVQDTAGTFLGLKTKDGTTTKVADLPQASSILQPFVRSACRTTDGKILTYELGIYGSGTGPDGKTAPLSYETWQYSEAGGKLRQVTKGSSPSQFAWQFTGIATPYAVQNQPGATVATTTGLMFRDQPVAIGSTVLEIAAPAESRKLVALGQGWVQASGLGRAKGKNGWLYGGYVRVTRGSSTYAPFACITTTRKVTVFLDDNLTGQTTTGLEPGDSVVATGLSPDKRAVRILLPSGTTGFVQASLVIVSN
jgi:hypothetical protein